MKDNYSFCNSNFSFSDFSKSKRHIKRLALAVFFKVDKTVSRTFMGNSAPFTEIESDFVITANHHYPTISLRDRRRMASSVNFVVSKLALSTQSTQSALAQKRKSGKKKAPPLFSLTHPFLDENR